MTASPTQVNGTSRPRRLPVMGDWRPIDSDSEQPEDTPTPTAAAPAPDLVAAAEAMAIRSRTEAELDERRIKAEAEADAIRIKAEAEAERTRLANKRTRMQMEQKQADHDKKLAQTRSETEEINRQTEEARKKAAAKQEAEETAAKDVEIADDKWRSYAVNFYRVCAVVALPVQLNAFYDRNALWLMAAPLMLEGGAWVVQKGAASAVANGRPSWHYRLIAWILAFIAAGINLWHGLNAFDPATAIGTAFASIAGPGVWDLHEHGRIRKRDGKPTRRERKAQERAERADAARKAAEEKQRAAEKEKAEKAAKEAAEQLAKEREEKFPKVWEHALKLAAALGETTVTEPVWRRAHNDIEGTDPGDSVDIIRTRNTNARRVAAARSEAPGNTPSKVTNAQRVPHLPPGPGRGSKTGPKVRGIRRQGDAPKFAPAARKQAAITAKNAATGDAN